VNVLDRVKSWLSPERAHLAEQTRRLHALLAAYEGAKTGRRVAGWLTSANSSNAEIGSSLHRLRERSRALIRDNHVARAAQDRYVTKIVGSGIIPRANSGDKRLDGIVNKAWAQWSRECSADGLPHFEAIEALVVRAAFESGEVLARYRYRRVGDGLQIPLQVQVLEPDYLDLDKNGTTDAGNYIVQGVEFNSWGKRVAYWLFGQHPGETFATGLRGGQTLQSARISADEVLHIYEPTRPGQARGVPRMAAVLLRLRDLDDWEDAELVRKKIEACLAGFIQSPEADGATVGIPSTDVNGNTVETFEPGMISRLKPGEEIRFNTPAFAGGYADYKRSILRDVAAGIDMPYEILTGDLSQINYSSYRAGLLGFRDSIASWQWNVLIPKLCQPIWDRFILAGQLAGEWNALEVPVEWAPPAFDLLDRANESEADETMLRIGTMTWPQAVARQGLDPEQQLEEIERYKARLEAAGVVFSQKALAAPKPQQTSA
jgi:lambda family phage portal protein